MVYGYDLAQLFPVQSLYDTGMINMYVNAVQREYERGLADQKEFMSKYGDFTSPFAKDIESWDNATIGAYNNLMNKLQEAGIDPLRSQEGRAAISRFINSRPYGDLAKLRLSAETGKEYQKALTHLVAEGKYNPLMEEEFGGTMNGYSTLEKGIWTKSSPYEYQGIKERTKDWFKLIKDRDYGTTDDGKYRIIGLNDEDAKDVVKNSLPSYLATPEGQFEQSTIRKQLKNAGIDPTDDAVNSILIDEILKANENNYGTRLEADEYKKIQYTNSFKNNQSHSSSGSGGGPDTNSSVLSPFQLATWNAALGDNAGIELWAVGGFDDKDNKMSEAILKNTAAVKDFSLGRRGIQYRSDELGKYISTGADSNRIYTYDQLNVDAYGASGRYGNGLEKRRKLAMLKTHNLRKLLATTWTDANSNRHQYKMNQSGKLLAVPVWVDGKLQLKLYAEAFITDDKDVRVTRINSSGKPASDSNGTPLSHAGRFLVEVGVGVIGTDKKLNITESATYWGSNSN